MKVSNPPTNDERVERAARVMNKYWDGEDHDTALCDLLADLRHWAEQYGVDFNRAALMGEIYFNSEKASE